MCGICGIVQCDGDQPVARELLASMSDAMLHRGSDGKGSHLGRGLVPDLLARTKSTVCALSARPQPRGQAGRSRAKDEARVDMLWGLVGNHEEAPHAEERFSLLVKKYQEWLHPGSGVWLCK